MSKLKSCPSCGQEGTAVFKESGKSSKVKVVCNVKRKGCGTSSGYAEDQAAAAALWNRRPEKKTIAYYIPGQGGFYLPGKLGGAEHINEAHLKMGIVRLVEDDNNE